MEKREDVHDETRVGNSGNENSGTSLLNENVELKKKQTERDFSLAFRDSVGWLSFSVVFNILNTIVYSALYPKILEAIEPDKDSYSTAFSLVNLITTLFSAIALPLLGSFVDCAQLIKSCLLVTQYIGIISTLGLFFLDLLPNSLRILHLFLNQILYIVAMFFLRTAVMNNNAMLSSFSKKNITILSLLGNFLGFSVNTVGLIVIVFGENLFPQKHLGITRENWWLLLFTCITIVVSTLTFFSPNAKILEFGDGKKKSILSVAKKSFKNMLDTFMNARKNMDYLKCWVFLFAYLFFSTAGTVMTIYLGPLFIAVYELSLPEVVVLNLYYKIMMVVGVLLGMVFEKFNVNDILTLVMQSTIFGIQMISLFLGIQFQLPYWVVLSLLLSVGLLYSWNASVARGCMSKLIPQGKACEFMGLYSTFTYLGISVVSGLNAISLRFKFPAQSICVLCFIWMLPSYILLYFLHLLNKRTKPTNDN